MTLYLGIDIGGTKIAAGLVTENGEALVTRQRPTDAARGGNHILSTALAVAEEIAAGHEIAAVGIGSGGQIDAEHGVVISATDVLPGWTGTDLRRVFAERWRRPVAADNDVNALAAGEQRFGSARGNRSVVFLALGTGVGGAFLLDGRLYHGAHWAGGELGHLVIDIRGDARRDTGGARGALEAYCSGSGLAATWREIAGEPLGTLSGKEIGELAGVNPGGVEAEAVRRTGEYLGWGLVSLANIFDPDKIVVGGGMASLGELLLDPARRILRENALPGPATCSVEAASLGEHASIIGAASLAMPRI